MRKLVLVALLAAVPAQAEVASLVRDLTPQTEWNDGRPANPFVFTAAGDRLVFAADDDAHGHELWTSDGTAEGTEILEDACPGECGSSAHAVGTTRSLSFWVLDSPRALWRSDGTRAGTFPVLDGVALGLGVDRWAVRDDVLFFPRCPFTGCSGLWRTDGTVAGTREIADLEVNHVALVGDRVLAATGDELWRIDPGSETPVPVLPLVQARFLAVVKGRLLLIASGPGGQELWSTDGTAAGTRALTQLAPTLPFGFTPNTAARGQRLYFVADDVQHGNELWVSDGTPQGTKRISDFGFYFPFDGALDLTLQETAGGRVVFAATDGLSEDTLQLWSTDGRPESTVKLLEPCPRECHPADEPPPYRTARAGSAVLFPAVDAASGIELWTTDGTVQGTRLFLDLCPGPCDSRPAFLPATPAGNGAYFSAREHIWHSDGTAAGTRQLTARPLQPSELLRPLIAEAGGRTYVKLGDFDGGHLGLLEEGEVRPLTFGSGLGAGSHIGRIFAQGGEVHFLIDEGSDDSGLWRSAGAAETTRLLSREVFLMESPVSAGGITFFFENGALWRATDDGIARIAELSDDFFREPQTAASLGAHLYFAAVRDGFSELWKTDGTDAGTVSVLKLPEGMALDLVAESGGRLYLGAYDEEESRQRLWTTDGTAAGLRELAAPVPYGLFQDPFVRAGGHDWFVESFGFDSASRLRRTDGTSAGTVPVPLADGPVRIADGILAHQGSLYVLGEDYDGFSGISALWRVEGGGTVVRLRTFARHPSNRALEIVSAGGLVLFTADDGEHGIELWATDGTPAGTRLVRDIAPGPFSSDAAGLTPIGGKVFFSAWDHAHGFELWQSDGTAAGTRLAHDIAPGPASSSPRALTAAEGRLYFTADDGLTGRELWTLPLGGPGCQPSARALCLQGGRFRAEAAWRDFQLNNGAGTAVPLTGDTGYFWFFNPANAEVVLKVLDGRGLNGHHWVFYGALSSVEYALTVTDTQTGLTARYLNPMGRLASVGDTTGFGPDGAFASQRATAVASPPALVRGWTSAAPAPCVPTAQRLCLNGGRFGVEASWKVGNNTGQGTAVPLTADAGYFWFFDAANVEVLLKVLDGRPLTGRFWVFYGALSNVEYTLTVTDSLTGEVKEYRNPSGRFASVADTGAF